MSVFDRKFGKKFLESVPTTPGIYRIYDLDSLLIYVGKAKNLRRRLGQYKNAKRRKKHRKMLKIMGHAARVEFEVCASELEAELMEAKLIQSERPKWNVVGAFYFLYPMIGMKVSEGVLHFCYTTQPEAFDGFEFHGAFRSREITRDAFFSLMKLLRYVGHSLPKGKKPVSPLPKYSYLYGFRQIPQDWVDHWSELWKGSSKQVLEFLVLALIENAGARKKGVEIQEMLNKLNRFWEHEAKPLLKARSQVGFTAYPVSQKDRDLVFLQYRRSIHTY